MGEITRLLRSAATGDEGARDALFAVAYPGLEKLARARLRDGGRNTLLDTRGLVHESYLRYVRGGELRADDRRAFFAFASQVATAVFTAGLTIFLVRYLGPHEFGVFSLAFWGEGLGAAVGGDYSKETEREGNAAWTEDGGQTWSAPQRVSDGPDDAANFTPAVAVTPEGWVGVSYYSLRDNPARVPGVIQWPEVIRAVSKYDTDLIARDLERSLRRRAV